MKSKGMGETWVCLKTNEKKPLKKPVSLAHNGCETLLVKYRNYLISLTNT